MIKIVFFGTPEFALPSLRALADSEKISVQAVVTQLDKPKGRSLQKTPSPIAQCAEELGLPVIKTEHLINNQKVFHQLNQYHADLYVVVAFGAILPSSLLALPAKGALNLHPSLLPRYRGSSPIQTAILNGDHETGITVILLDEKMDHGPIVAQQTILINPTDTSPTLSDRLARLGAQFLVNGMLDYANGKVQPQPQDDIHASYTKQLTKGDGKIDWSKTSDEIARQIRAYKPWPGSWTILDQKEKLIMLKIIEAVPIHDMAENERNSLSSASGQLIQLSKKRYAFVCGNGTFLQLNAVQPANRTVMSADSFIRGNPQFLSPL
ncbi:MAG: methionyl-tRNA formyltransferase [Patescibacteria group bacterium]